MDKDILKLLEVASTLSDLRKQRLLGYAEGMRAGNQMEVTNGTVHVPVQAAGAAAGV